MLPENWNLDRSLSSRAMAGDRMPRIVGRFFIAHETREKFRELRDEILRSKQAAAAR